MALVVADRVKETTTTTGTGTYTLAGAVDGFQSFAAVGNGNTTYYACSDGTDYEVGIGTYTASGTTLARTTIIESSNSDAAVNWGAGEKQIFVTLPASKAIFEDASNNVAVGNNITVGGTVDGVDIATRDAVLTSTTTTANAALPKSGGTMTGNIVMSGTQTVDGRDLSVDGAKLDNIEANATADQTAAEIEAIVNHDNLQGFVTNEHIDWTASGAGTIHATNIPTVALTTVQTAANQTAHLALTAQEGDIVVRSDENKSYVHNGGTAGTMADYTLLLTPTDAVLSVNGQTGAVTISSATTSSAGLMSSTDKSKLDGVESGATADQTITAGSGLTGGGTGNVTISHADTSTQASVNGSGRTYIQDITLDTYGHVTAIGTATETVTDTNTTSLPIENSAGTVQFTATDTTGLQFAGSGATSVAFDSTNKRVTISSTDTDTNTTYSAGSGINLSGTTFSHADTSSQASVNNSGRTYIQDISLDTYGHITSITSATETVVNTDTNTTDWRVANSAGTEQFAVSAAEQVRFAASGAASVAFNSTTQTITISATDTNTDTTNFNIQANSGTQVNISAGEEINFINGNATTAVVTNQANPTVTFNHNDTSSQASVNNSNGTVIQDVYLDGFGHVTGLSSVDLDGRYVAKNTGYIWTSTGANALSFQSNDTIDSATGDLASLEVYQDTAGADAFMQFHVAGDYAKYFGLHGGINDFVVGGWSSGASYQRLFHDGYHPNADTWTTGRTIALTGDVTGTSGTFNGSANLSFATNIAANVVGANELNVTGNGSTAQFLRSDGDGSFTWATPTDTNTTYSAGTGLDLSGTTFSIESDLRGEVSLIGYSGSDYIQSTNTKVAFYFGGPEEFRFDSSGNLHADGNVVSNSTTISSDEKLKDNIKVVDNALDKLHQLRGVTFDWKRDGQSSAGVIAQDVMKVMPEAVLSVEGLKSKESYLTVNYSALTSILIEAIKEQQEQIDELKKKLNG